MEFALLIKAAVMGIVEGFTEFLPISSTGHLILAGSLLEFTGDKVKVFEVAIQTGAMLAVMWEYRRRLTETVRGIGSEAAAQRFARNMLIAFLPAVCVGLALGALIQSHLFHPVPVAIAFVIGGLIILWVEHRHRHRSNMQGQGRARVESVDDISALDALKVGLVQCVALVPGTSRSGATIIGAMAFGFSRKAATEFSFFLGIPTIFGASVYALYKQRELLSVADLPLFAVGQVFSFVSALLCIRWLMRFVEKHDFRMFAYYRVAFGALVLLTWHTGSVVWTD